MSSNYFMMVSDPQYMEKRFSTRNRLRPKSFVRPTFNISISSIRPFLEQIPSREADFLELYFLLEKNQAEIASIFRVCQGTVCHRLKKAISRIKFLLSLPQIPISTMMGELSEFLAERDARIMIEMYRKTCQSQVAMELGLSQCYVRHRFLQSIETIEMASMEHPHLEKYVSAFIKIKENFNILREIKLPRWSRANRILDNGSEFPELLSMN